MINETYYSLLDCYCDSVINNKVEMRRFLETDLHGASSDLIFD